MWGAQVVRLSFPPGGAGHAILLQVSLFVFERVCVCVMPRPSGRGGPLLPVLSPFPPPSLRSNDRAPFLPSLSPPFLMLPHPFELLRHPSLTSASLPPHSRSLPSAPSLPPTRGADGVSGGAPTPFDLSVNSLGQRLTRTLWVCRGRWWSTNSWLRPTVTG